MLSHHSSTFVPYTTLFRSQASFWRICFANPRLVQSSKAHIHNCGLHRALSELSLKRDKADRKSTLLNSSHVAISYAVFCLKKTILDIMLATRNPYILQLR